MLILASLAISSTGIGAMVGLSATVVIVLYLIFMIASIVVLIFTVRFLKGKSDSKTTIGVLNLVFAVLIGILIAIFSSTMGIVVGIIVILLGLIGGILILTAK